VDGIDKAKIDDIDADFRVDDLREGIQEISGRERD
jgi:hypothetical protein